LTTIIQRSSQLPVSATFMARTDSRIELKKSSRYPGNDVQLPSKLSPDCKSPGSACLIAILQTLKIDKIVSF